MEEFGECMADEGFWAMVERKGDGGAIYHNCMINGVCVRALIDSGAEIMMCKPAVANSMGLSVPNGSAVKFRGVGDAVAQRSEPVRVQLEGSDCVVECPVFVLDVPADVIVGREVLRKSNAVIDFSTNEVVLLVDPQDDEVEEVGNVVEEKLRIHDVEKVDAVSGVNEQLSERELLHMRIKELEEVIPVHLSRKQRRAVVDVFLRYTKVWLKPRAGMAKTSPVQIRGVNGPPVRMRLRSLSTAMKAEVDKQIDSMLASGVIRQSKSPWAASIVIVPKKDGGWRMAIDYRGLNKTVIHDAYPTALICEILKELAGKMFTSVFDLNWGFWNLGLHEDSCYVTAFLTHRGLFEFTVLPIWYKYSGIGDAEADG
eukprot:GHVQ01038768.1.p1 GENE.GHVQ01038768.1~~GHVQ01038768.1.p1  ORF type:complete len:370 (+),score=52.80 GHVQ01038768.1:840-1949(+)